MTTDRNETGQKWEPVLTANVPIPILEAASSTSRSSEMPRILAQRAAERRATRRTLLLIAFLLVLTAGEILTYLRLPDVTRLVVYDEPTHDFLVNDE